MKFIISFFCVQINLNGVKTEGNQKPKAHDSNTSLYYIFFLIFAVFAACFFFVFSSLSVRCLSANIYHSFCLFVRCVWFIMRLWWRRQKRGKHNQWTQNIHNHWLSKASEYFLLLRSISSVYLYDFRACHRYISYHSHWMLCLFLSKLRVPGWLLHIYAFSSFNLLIEWSIFAIFDSNATKLIRLASSYSHFVSAWTLNRNTHVWYKFALTYTRTSLSQVSQSHNVIAKIQWSDI